MAEQPKDSSSSSRKLGITKSNPKAALLQNARGCFASLSCSGSGAVGEVGLFLLKLAALETVRRVSKSKCPPLWHGVQALQFLCYPPFKWIQRWAPLKGLVRGMQMISRPLLVLSVATAVSDELTHSGETLDDNDRSRVHSDTSPEEPPPSSVSALDASPKIGDGDAENWMLELQKELANQGITLPERINEDELRRFYDAAEGDSQSFLLSIKNTIRWRETYRILSEEELGMWSNVVFWHGYNFNKQPCLIVRLGLACTNLPVQDRPRFAQFTNELVNDSVSQVEYGILHFLNKDNPHIMVIVDCAGITPLRIPMQMVRSCSSYLQHNFPNRLGRLLIIRLPPVARVIAQTFLQILKPVTKKKLRVEGKMYRKVLSEYLDAVPAYLGGCCACQRCMETTGNNHTMKNTEHDGYIGDRDDRTLSLMNSDVDSPANPELDRLIKTGVIGILMLWVFVALVVGFYDPETRPFL
ncbi:SEC14 cytosolic factor [Linum grandiflorum]